MQIVFPPPQDPSTIIYRNDVVSSVEVLKPITRQFMVKNVDLALDATISAFKRAILQLNCAKNDR